MKKAKVNISVKKWFLRNGYFLVSFEESEKIKRKYFEMGERYNEMNRVNLINFKKGGVK